MKGTKTHKVSEQDKWIHEFENLYILTYKSLYRHAKLIFGQEEKAKELLIQVYMEAYQRGSQLQKEKSPADWLLKRSDFLAETKLEATREMIEASYAEEKMQSKEARKENLTNLDETSLLLEIEDRLGIVEGTGEYPDETDVSRGKRIWSIVLLIAAILLAIVGIWKVKHQLDLLQAPFERTFHQTEETEAKKETIEIQLGDKAVVLSEAGQILYTVPLEESNLAGEHDYNEEIQTRDGWTYYLPCPERKDSQLSKVHPSLYHTLYRSDTDQEIEVIAQDVDNFTFWEDGIYIMQYGSVQRISVDAAFATQQIGAYAAVQNDEIYLYDTLGRTLQTDIDGNLQYGDRVFKMSGNRIEDIMTAKHQYGSSEYYLKEQNDGEGQAIFCKKGGNEKLFESMGKSIDSFCIVGDWIYYSAWMKGKERGKQYSQLFRLSLTEEDAEVEELHKRYPGRIWQLYYSEEGDQIYGNYAPENWKNGYGVIAVISRSGQMSYLDDAELRERQETTGNDRVKFVMMQDGQVYGYWEDCYWKKGEVPVPMWRKVLVIPDKNRVVIED
ncbi:hypothetical protein DXB18_14705 [Clostridium sp. OM02-18AC]|uniref:hypothetical protein n=1 Tax=Clostridium sp. OM02-18AC TaxID=2292311 RepID=UPI000E5191BC|nr:hypothetical protein [Clostridium sp. OM02-18AC]RHV62942.1 hypothetical protein DXB18_14705 [Clostridium sp. OM02-18AC]